MEYRLQAEGCEGNRFRLKAVLHAFFFPSLLTHYQIPILLRRLVVPMPLRHPLYAFGG